MDGAATQLAAKVLGRGPRVVLVHGSVVGAEVTWRHQEALAESWTLVLADRPGFGASSPLARGDFELEAPMVAELLGDGAHLIGHSYGGVIALLAAGLRPDAVRSLTVSEPGLLRLGAEEPAIEAMIANGSLLYARREQLGADAFLRMFRAGAGSIHPTPAEVSGDLLRGAEHAMRERPPWEAEVPVAVLAGADFPKLVISGDHSAEFDLVCDLLADAIGARRAVLAGRAHSIPKTGEPYNRCLHEFMSAAESAGARQ